MSLTSYRAAPPRVGMDVKSTRLGAFELDRVREEFLFFAGLAATYSSVP